jgi:hypothetical protein
MEIEILTQMRWWITVIEIPVITFLFTMILKNKTELLNRHEKLQHLIETNYIQLKEGISAYKLEVAKSYASISSLKDVEKRLVEHLLRIEKKL